MAKDLNSVSGKYLIELIKGDPILQASLVVAVMLGFMLATASTSTTTPATVPVTAQGGPPPVTPPTPGPPAPVATPGTPFNSPAPLFGGKTPQQQAPQAIKEIKPGQSLDAVATPEAGKANESFGRVREKSSSTVEVKK